MSINQGKRSIAYFTFPEPSVASTSTEPVSMPTGDSYVDIRMGDQVPLLPTTAAWSHESIIVNDRYGRAFFHNENRPILFLFAYKCA